jgi:hypothetical protein
MRALPALIAVLSLALAGPARAFNESTHEGITREALRAMPDLGVVRAPPDAGALARFRNHLHHLLARDPAFAARYPTVDGFDAWAMKEYLALSPEARVFGIDVVTADPLPARDLIALASRQPDEDFRNMNRYARDARRRILQDGSGRPIPADPATLEMGALTGLSSQAHAHYQLPPGPKSDDPSVLKSDPARFAMPPDAHTFGARFTQRFFALAAIARAWDDPAALYLADLYLGHALHYAQDAASQVHTDSSGPIA